MAIINNKQNCTLITVYNSTYLTSTEPQKQIYNLFNSYSHLLNITLT